MKPLQGKRMEIVEFIQIYTNCHGYAPSVREIGKAVGLASTSSVQNYLIQLQEAGVLTKKSSSARTIKLLV